MSTVIYVAIIEGDQDAGYSAFFPDLPGCVTASRTMVELPAAARDALSLHLQGMAEDGETFPEPTPIEAIRHDPEIEEVGYVLVDADVEDAPVRVNISIGAQFLKRLDIAAETRGMTRSGFLVEAARTVIENDDAQSNRRDSEDWRTFVTDHLVSTSDASHSQKSKDFHFISCLHDLSAANELQRCLATTAQNSIGKRYLVIPAGREQNLSVVWDALHNQVVDVVMNGTDHKTLESGQVLSISESELDGKPKSSWSPYSRHRGNRFLKTRL